jgi:SEC-C motif
MDDDEFDEFRRGIVDPMIARHHAMFPFLHQRLFGDLAVSLPSPRRQLDTVTPTEEYAVTDRYAPCPCNSGRKFKFCCGKKGS